MAGLKTPTHLRDAIIEAEIRQQRQDFIDSLRPDDILRLAASYHASGSEGVFFREPARGSYNMCYFVEFPPSDETTGVAPDRWVVRVPLDPYLASGPRDKLESEMATMM